MQSATDLTLPLLVSAGCQRFLEIFAGVWVRDHLLGILPALFHLQMPISGRCVLGKGSYYKISLMPCWMTSSRCYHHTA
jgi:hypothetical protein